MYTIGRRNREHRVLDVISLDRGKRHYWGDSNGDYGFLESEDRKQIRKFRETRNRITHRRNQTLGDINPELEHEGYQLYHDTIKMTDRDEREAERKETKKNLQITNNIQIHLPAIEKNKSTLVEPTNQSKLTMDNYSSTKIIREAENTKTVRFMKDADKKRNIRAKTQACDYYGVKKYPFKVRYTPTFICSLGNPMPTYKLLPNGHPLSQPQNQQQCPESY